MTGKQRATLKRMSQKLDCVVYIGKDGLTETVVESVKQALEARELIKCGVQQNCEFSAKEASLFLCGLTGAEGISCIGRKFVLYKRSDKNILSL